MSVASPHVHVPYHKIAPHLPLINRHRLNMEIYFDAAALDSADTLSPDKLKKMLEYTPSISFHAPFMDLCPGAIDHRIREATIFRFNQILGAAETLSPACIVFHSGYEKWKYGLSVNQWLEKSLETWGPINDRAKNLGVKIGIENIFEDTPENLKLLMKEMSSGNFGVCFDTGHCNLFSKVPLDDWLNNLGPYIIELHLHDNDGSADQHLPIGDGTFDFRTLLSSLKHDPQLIYTIEAHSPERVLKSLSRLHELISSL